MTVFEDKELKAFYELTDIIYEVCSRKFGAEKWNSMTASQQHNAMITAAKEYHQTLKERYEK